MKHQLLSFILALFSFATLFAQKPATNYCATDQLTQDLYKKYPDRKKKAAEIDTAIYEQVKKITASSREGNLRGPVRVVPVVVHIIHNNGPENISNIQVLQAVQHLNDAFRNIGVMQDAAGIDTEIEFCMAQRDPNGNATNGITRTVSTLTNMVMENDDVALKNLIRWNPNLYLNIWLVNDITSIANGPGVSGYASGPSSHGLNDDGIVNEAFYFGSNPTNSKVHIHEAGHYLGLLHTFESGCVNNNCLLDGDKICDTPPDNSTANITCGTTINTCTTDDDDLSVNNPFRPIANGGIGDQNDLIEDHMDYGDVACHTLFTLGQKNRMQAVVTGPRASLLQSIACTSPCNTPINISFTPNTTTTINLGGTINFTNTTTGATNYNWSINNSSFATTTNASNTFNTAGSYWVVLTATNGDPNCQKQDSVLIIVKCTVSATFTSSATSVGIGGSVTFTSTTPGATSYQWYIDGVPQVTTPNFTTPFPNAGGYNVYLVACNGVCCDTSKFQLIAVGTCNSKEANIWFFGYNAGWDFNSGAPVPLAGSAMRAEEACATIADKNGQVLMYCDGQTICNKNHQIMQNGNFLFGARTSSMGSLIVPKPGSNTIYYVFTLAGNYGTASDPHFNPYFVNTFPAGALSYSIVDITLNGGLGAVTTKNQVLLKGLTEKLVGIHHSNGTDIWIVTHDSLDNFYSNLITCNGIDTIPVIIKSGFMHSSKYQRGDNAMGMMMISPNGKKIALNARTSGTQLGDFNTTTGVVSNMQTINPTNLTQTQGLAFSPDSRKLYINGTNGTFGVFQFNVTLGTPAAVTASMITLPTNNACIYTGLQLATDGRIYMSELNAIALHVINNPNATGAACNLVLGAVPLGVATAARFTLPNFLVDYILPKKAAKIQGPTVLCAPSTYYIKNNCGLGDSVGWILNGTSTITSMIDSAITLTPTAVSATDTLISVQYSSCGVVTDTLLIQISNGSLVLLGNDTTICGAINLTLNAGAGFNPYLWSTNATTQTINVTTPGTYWVQVTSGSCVSSDTIVITQAPALPNVNLGPDTTACEGKIITLNAGPGYQTYTWYDNSNNQTNSVWQPGTYWVTVKDFCGNISSDTIKVLPNLTGSISLGNDTIICNNQAINLSPGTGYLYYSWSDSTSASNLSVNATGTYWVQVTDSLGCSYKDTVNVVITTGPTISLGNDTTTCDYTTFTLGVANNYASYLWNTNATNSSINVTAAGTYWLEVTDSAGCTKRDTIVISQSTNPTVNLGNDTVICNFTSLTLNAGSGFVSYSWNTTASSPTINATTSGLYWVLVTDSSGCIARDSMTISQVTSKPNVSLGNNSVLCQGQTAVLDAGAGYQSYTWQNSSTAQTYTATGAGTYYVTVQDSCGNISKDTVIIQADNALPVALGPDLLICDDEAVTFDAGSNYATYLWQDGSGNQTFSFTGTAGTYHVQVTSANGCSYRDTVLVTIDDCDTVPLICDISNVPNAFSPNNDLTNDEFCLQGWEGCVKTFNVVIYDRWGQKMFESTDPAFCWDGVYKGKIMDAQVFVYYIDALTKNNEVIHRTGNISLIR